MGASEIIRMITPPAAFKAAENLSKYGSIRATPEYGSITQTRAELAHAGDDPWQHPNWISHISSVSTDLPVSPYSHEAALMMLCAELPTADIFDFGGGPAVLYPSAKTSGRYVVLENEQVAQIGKARFPDVTFIQDVALAPTLVRPGGITLCVGTLHYILDWRSALAALVTTAPKYVMIGRHPTSETELWGIQTITTALGYCGKAQMAFIPADALSLAMKGLGYDFYANIPLGDQRGHVTRESRPLLPNLTSRNLIFKITNPE